MNKEKLAIIGSGVAGMACAYLLQDAFDVTVIEKQDRLGGHTNTRLAQSEAGEVSEVSIDTGFMVFNKVTYPNLIKLFRKLNIDSIPTDMSFSVNHLPENIEWNGAGLNKLFAQRENIFRPRYWQFLRELDRFNKLATTAAQDNTFEGLSVQHFMHEAQFSNDFLHWYLIPMSGAIWSTAANDLLDFPIQMLMRFFYNHGFLGLHTHHQWYTVKNGASSYMKKIRQNFNGQMITGSGVQTITYDNTATKAASITLDSDEVLHFDRAILAAHADESLAMLSSPSSLEQELLRPFQYQYNHTLLHTDARVMPKRKRAWASWNYRIADSQKPATTHYWMNNLQHIHTQTQFFVSLNAEHEIDSQKVIEQIDYHHPVYTLEALRAQQRLPELNTQPERPKLHFCGSYFKYGFHEDALSSAIAVCEQLLGRRGVL